MGRLTDNDRNWGPFTWARSSGWNPWRLVWSSGGGGDNDERVRNDITLYLFGHILRVWLPTIIKPWSVVRQGNLPNKEPYKYTEVFPREYGFCVNDGSLHLYLGAQTHDSVSTQDWYWSFPWMQWRLLSEAYYHASGTLCAFLPTSPTASKERYERAREAQERCLKARFAFTDYDGERIIATTTIEETVFVRGTGGFKWLSWFCPARVRRSLKISFSSEVGSEKGSWKGGTTGTGVEMLAGDTPLTAFLRYSRDVRRHRGVRYILRNIEVLP